MFSLVAMPAHAGLVGATVKPTFYADIPEFDDPPKPVGDFDPTQVDDGTVAPFVITNGSTFTFYDYFYGGAFGTFLKVTLSDTQIILTNLIPGLFPEYTAAGFQFMFPAGRSIVDVTADAGASSPLFLPGSLLSFTGDSILLVLSNTCSDACVGITQGGPGESIVLNVRAIPEPASVALVGIGLLPLLLRRRTG